MGGFEGQWASDLFSKYVCEIHVFEPVKSFAEKIRTRFNRNNRIRVHTLGLANETKEAIIYVSNNCTSLLKPNDNPESIKLIKVEEFLKNESIEYIDLVKINIEGAEYDLIEYLVDSGLIKNIGNIQVQFHDFFPDASTRMEAIQKSLSVTHNLTWQFPFVWENWTIKNDFYRI